MFRLSILPSRLIRGWPKEDNAEVAFWEGLTVNGFNAAAAIAAVLAGHLLVDRHGRKPALLMGTLLFALGGAVTLGEKQSLGSL